jgi:hypothetical protein
MNLIRNAIIKYPEICNGETNLFRKWDTTERKKRGGPERPPRMVQSIKSAYIQVHFKSTKMKDKKICLNVNLSDLRIVVNGLSNSI